MKKLLFLALAFATLKMQAQTADEIIQKYSNAMGGVENFRKVKTARLTGTASAQGQEFPLTVQIVNGTAMRTDVEVMGQTITNVYKDGKGWKINPYGGAPEATDVSGDELNEFKAQSSLVTQLMDFKARGYKAELLGQEDVNGIKAHKIRLTTEGDKQTVYFIDPTNYMLLKTVSTRNMMGQDMQVETYYSDVKDTGNIRMSMSRRIDANGQTLQEVHFDKLELDVAIDDKIFDKK
jgi:outer membrane lipoprotein-sorting protein